MGALGAVAAAVGILLAAFWIVPPLLIRRAQDRMAGERVKRDSGIRLLTRADLISGRWRRVPGLLGLTEESLFFEGVFGENRILSTSRIVKIATGSKLASGRLLLRREVLRITGTDGGEVEFVLTLPAASAWRSHLGLWAMKERQADADRVSPGRTN